LFKRACSNRTTFVETNLLAGPLNELDVARFSQVEQRIGVQTSHGFEQTIRHGFQRSPRLRARLESLLDGCVIGIGQRDPHSHPDWIEVHTHNAIPQSLLPYVAETATALLPMLPPVFEFRTADPIRPTQKGAAHTPCRNVETAVFTG